MEKIDTGTDQLLVEKENGVATIILNRPEVRNALSTQLTPAPVSYTHLTLPTNDQV